MKPTHDWHRTKLGSAVLFLGSIRFAVPVMVLVAIALAWGTYLESMHDSRVSRATVYGSWWFVGLMAMIALSLILAVVTRYPWKRKHVGFITVHAGLVLMIIAGFWSLFERLEGHLVLEEGQTSNILETDQEVLELAEFSAGKSTIVGYTQAPTSPGSVLIDGTQITITEYWDNSREEQYVADDGPNPLRAIEVSLDPAAKAGDWVAEEDQAARPIMLGGIALRVLPDGASWTPPAPTDGAPGYFFTLSGTRHPLVDPGAEVFPGWTITSVERFSHAMVSAGRISESGDGEPNPAIDVTITNGSGTIERHTAFMNFPDMVLSKRIEGTESSGARLSATAPRIEGEQLFVFGPVGSMRIGYVGADGAGRKLDGPFTAPVVLEVGTRRIAILREFARARVASRFVPAPKTSERRPALVVTLPGEDHPTTIAYKSMVPVTGGGRNLLLRYGPRIVELPFTFTLKDFRKRDYPGTDMAMAYESDVMVAMPGREPFPFLVYMNAPFAHHPWKVYQSGFMGENISIFSVMKDPGIPLTYAASIILCVGIFLTFFSRTFSWGHPGIPTAFSETRRATHVAHNETPVAGPGSRVPEPVGAGV